MKYVLLFLLSYLYFQVNAQTTFPLFPEGIPCANNLQLEIEPRDIGGRIFRKVHEPVIEVYLPAPEKNTGTGVVICPGGGYTILAYDKEGIDIAKWLNDHGVAAFVLQYRLPHWEEEACKSKVALMDAQRAIRLVRSKAEAFNINPDKIGILGFSAGGHLASTASTHFDEGIKDSNYPVDAFSCRPDFSVLVYPVISMDTTITHMGSRNNLIGEKPAIDMEMQFSNEKQITVNTPPAILIHANDDKAVLPENSLVYYQGLRKNNVDATLLIYPSGGHGFGLAKGKGAVEQWPDACIRWMKEKDLLK